MKNSNQKVEKKVEKKIDFSNVELDQIPDLRIRLEEKFRREMVSLEKSIELEKKNQEIRISKIEKLESFVSNKEILELFPNINSSKDLILEMIDLLEMKEEIKSSLNLKKSGKLEFIPDSSHVFHFKLYKGVNNSLGDRKIGGEILPKFGFPNIEDFSNPYPNSVKLREGGFDSLLNEDHYKILEDNNLLGNIKSRPVENLNLWVEKKEVN